MPAQAATAYERGTQAVIINAIAVNQGAFTAGGAPPATSAIFGLPPTVSRGQLPFKIAIQVDTVGATAGLAVSILGSLDGVHFYALPVIGTPSATGGFIVAVDPAVVRFISAQITAGTFTSCTVSMAA